MASAEKSLKDRNRPSLLLVIVANALVLYLAMQAKPVALDGISALLKNWVLAVPAAGVFVITTILTEIVPSIAKARLVFWRWNDPLPGSRAFSELAHDDPRVDVKALEASVGAFPSSAKDQNSLWYKLYLAKASDIRVEQAHQHFLFARDYTALSVIFLIVGAIAGFWFVRPLQGAMLYVAFLVAQYLIVRFAARNQGQRFVATVLALAAVR